MLGISIIFQLILFFIDFFSKTKYNLPMISFRNTVYIEMIENRLKWDEVGSDEVHPNDYGHFIISELLIDFKTFNQKY